MIKPEQVPICVRQKLRRMVYDFETNEAVLIAGVLNEWPGVQHISEEYGACVFLPLPQEVSDE